MLVDKIPKMEKLKADCLSFVHGSTFSRILGKRKHLIAPYIVIFWYGNDTQYALNSFATERVARKYYNNLIRGTIKGTNYGNRTHCP